MVSHYTTFKFNKQVSASGNNVVDDLDDSDNGPKTVLAQLQNF